MENQSGVSTCTHFKLFTKQGEFLLIHNFIHQTARPKTMNKDYNILINPKNPWP